MTPRILIAIISVRDVPKTLNGSFFFLYENFNFLGILEYQMSGRGCKLPPTIHLPDSKLSAIVIQESSNAHPTVPGVMQSYIR